MKDDRLRGIRSVRDRTSAPCRVGEAAPASLTVCRPWATGRCRARQRRGDSLRTSGHVLAILAVHPDPAGRRGRRCAAGLPQLLRRRGHPGQPRRLAVSSSAGAAARRDRAGRGRRPPPPGADPPRRRGASHHDRRTGRRGDRDRNPATPRRAGCEGRRTLSARLRAPAAQSGSSRQRMMGPLARVVVALLLALLVAAPAAAQAPPAAPTPTPAPAQTAPAEAAPPERPRSAALLGEVADNVA